MILQRTRVVDTPLASDIEDVWDTIMRKPITDPKQVYMNSKKRLGRLRQRVRNEARKGSRVVLVELVNGDLKFTGDAEICLAISKADIAMPTVDEHRAERNNNQPTAISQPTSTTSQVVSDFSPRCYSMQGK